MQRSGEEFPKQQEKHAQGHEGWNEPSDYATAAFSPQKDIY